MAELPNTYARRPTPRFGGVDRANPVVESGDIAIGRGIQGFAQGMGQFLQREKAKRDKIELDDYTTRAKREAMLLTKQYQQKKGATVAEDKTFYMDAMDQYGQMKERLLSEVGDPGVHKSLGQRLELGSVNFQEGLIDHVYNEQQRYGDEVYESTIEVEAEDMGANFKSDSQVLQSTDRIKQMTHDYAKAKGVPLNSDMYKKMLRDNLTKGHVNVIEAWVEADNPAAAAEYFDEVKDEIDGDVHDNINKLLKTSGVKQRSIEYSDALFDQRPAGMTDAEFTRWGTDRIRDNVSDEDRDETVRRFKARIGENSAIDKQIKVDYGDQAYSIYNDSVEAGLSPMEAFNSIPDTILDRMDPTTVTAMRNMAEKRAQNKTIHTDFAAWNELYNLATGTPEEVARFRDRTQTNLDNYMDRISTTHLQQFRVMQADEEKRQIASSKAEIKKKFAKDTGMNIMEANDLLDREMDAQTALTKKEQTAADLRDIAASQTREILKKRSLKFWTAAPFGFTTSDMAYEAEIEGVPQEMINELGDKVRELKDKVGDDSEVTEEDILKLYHRYFPVPSELPGDSTYYDPARSMPWFGQR